MDEKTCIFLKNLASDITENNCLDCKEYEIPLKESNCWCEPVLDIISMELVLHNFVNYECAVATEWEELQRKNLHGDNNDD